MLFEELGPIINSGSSRVYERDEKLPPGSDQEILFGKILTV